MAGPSRACKPPRQPMAGLYAQATLMRALATRRLQADDAAAEHFLEPQDSDAGAEAWGPDIGGEEILDAGEAPDDLSPS